MTPKLCYVVNLTHENINDNMRTLKNIPVDLFVVIIIQSVIWYV